MAFDFPNSPTVGQVYQGYTWDGEKWASSASMPNVGGVIRIVVFTASGSYVPSANMTTAVIEAVGGGGGGGGTTTSSASQAFVAAGGGASGYSKSVVTAAQVGASQAVTIGAGGNGGAIGANPGVAGSNTSVGSFCMARGGSGGGYGAAGIVPIGGAGGAVGTGDETLVGAPGGNGFLNNANASILAPGGVGGSSALGGGAPGVYGSPANGFAAVGYGGGGGGGCCAGGGTATGGNGAPGAVIVTEYGMAAPLGASTGFVPRSYLAGLTLSTAGSSATFGIAAGVAADSTNIAMMQLNAAVTKTTGAWVVGSGNGALDTGTIGAASWYHVFLIRRPDTGVVDVLVSLSPTAPTLPANYTQSRRIGSMKTVASQWVQFVQIGDEFLWFNNQLDADGAVPSVTAVPVTLTTPTGVVTNALFHGSIVFAGNQALLFSALDEADVAPYSLGTGQANGSMAGSTACSFLSGDFNIRTNTVSQIRVRGISATSHYTIATRGYIDRRGRDA